MTQDKTDDRSDNRFSLLSDSFVDYLEEFLEARDDLSNEERKTPPSSRQIVAAKERLSEARYSLRKLFELDLE